MSDSKLEVISRNNTCEECKEEGINACEEVKKVCVVSEVQPKIIEEYYDNSYSKYVKLRVFVEVKER